MKHKTWFRLLVKALGLGLMAISIGHLVQLVVMIGFAGLLPGTLTSLGWYASVGSGHVVAFFIGLYMFLGGNWIVNFVIPSNHPYCPECGYDLSSTKGAICTECGVTLPEELARRDESAASSDV